jgi:quinol monooxygenase YgiN
MHEQIAWSVELRIKPGKSADFQALTEKMVAAAAKETGVLAYQRFVDPTGHVIHVYERYTNSAAAAAHLQIFREQFSDRFSHLAERAGFTVYGIPDDRLKRLLDQLGAVYFQPFGDCNYWP